MNEDTEVFEENLWALGHDEQLAEQDGLFGVGKVVERLAEMSELANQFNEIYVLHSKRSDFIACVNLKDLSLYINANQSLISPNTLIRTLKGLMLHETLHLNKFLGIPATQENGARHVKIVKKKGGSGSYLNWVYDLEGHYQANQKGFFSELHQLELREFLTVTRNAMAELDSKNPLLALENPITKEQKAIKSIVENRGLSVTDKALAIEKILKESKNKSGGSGDSGDGSGEQNEQGEQKEKGEKGESTESGDGRCPATLVIGIEKGDDDVIVKNNGFENITEKVIGEAEYNNIIRKVTQHGVKGGIVKDVVRYYRERSINPLMDLEKLNKSLKDLQGFDEGFMKSKVSINRLGSRVNGYRRVRDFNEVADSPESLLTDGEHDINSVRVPNRVVRKQKGVVIIVRDISGSVLEEPTDRVVRDVTMYLISEAKKCGHRVGVIDFNVCSKVIEDSKGKFLTNEYDGLLCKTALLKGGGGTNLVCAVDRLNRLINEEKLGDVPINVFVVTDSWIHNRIKLGDKRCNIKHEKVNLVGIVYDGTCIDFQNWVANHKGKIFEIELSPDKKLIKGLSGVV